MQGKIFLSIRTHKGVYLQNSIVSHPDEMDAKEEFTEHSLNLLQVDEIYYQEECLFYSSGSGDDKYPAIRFVKYDGDSFAINCALIFKSDGMGEYHRYKRLIDKLSLEDG